MRESKDEPQTAVQQSMRVYGSKPAVVGCRKYFSTGETIEATVFEPKPPVIKGPILGIGVQEWAANCTPAMCTELYIQTVDGGKNTSKHDEIVQKNLSVGETTRPTVFGRNPLQFKGVLNEVPRAPGWRDRRERRPRSALAGRCTGRSPCCPSRAWRR